jgi:starch phosphorylase
MEMIEMDALVKKKAQQIKHYLITQLGKTDSEVTDEEFYRALSAVLREEVMVNWTATTHSHMQKNVKKLYYLSLEWLPGRMFVNNVTNISSLDLVKRVLKYMNREYQKVINSENEAGLGNGGLGRLAACFLDSLATKGYPAMGYGLRYQYGIFEQELWSGAQLERPDCWLLTEFPWEIRRDAFATMVKYGGKTITKRNQHDEEVHVLIDSEDVRALPYDIPVVGYKGSEDFNVLTTRFWTTKESPRNFQLARFNAGDLSDANKNVSLTDVLYPNEKNTMGLHMRLRQEYLLVASSIQDIFRQYFLVNKTLDEFPNLVRIQINDTHPALTIAELMRIFTEEHHLQWAHAWEIVRTCCSYTNHTILKESLEEWDRGLMAETLPRQMKIIEKLNFEFCNQVRARFPNNEDIVRKMSVIENGRVRMAHLAIVGSHKVNGVAELHSKILKNEVFPEFEQMRPDLFTNVTNGVTQRRWLLSCNPKHAKMITDLIGNDWITDFPKIKKLAEFASDRDVQDHFLLVKMENKKRLVNALVKYKQDRYGADIDLKKDFFLEGDAIFDVLVKRIHEYKRQLMKALHILMLYNDIKRDPSCVVVKRKVLIAGKAAPGYDMAKNIIRLFYMLSKKINNDPVVSEKLKVIFIENYNVSKAEIIIPAADLSNQISTAGQEASGTSNMKFAMNGALTIGTDDGANIEMRRAVTDQWWPFAFGCSSEDLQRMNRDKSYHPGEILEQDAQIRDALNLLKSGDLADNEVEAAVLTSIYNSLTTGYNPDRYFVLKDLRPYYEAQQKVSQLYQNPRKWAEYALHNIAAMGEFSSDESIKNYATKIWGLKPVPIDPIELARVRKDFEAMDRCLIN